MHYISGDVHRPVPGWASSRLHGTGRVADDLYFVAHHEATGRPYLSPRSAGIALAGGLLAELLAAPTPPITLERGCLLPLYRRNGDPVARYGRPDEQISGHVLDLIAAESPPRPAHDWLLFLGKTAAADVAGRLERSGYLTRPPTRVPRRARKLVPVESDSPRCALLRAHAALDAARPLTPYSGLLTGLTVASGLAFRFSDLSREPTRSTDEAVQALARPLQELIACVQVTADAAVLSARS